MLTHGTITLNQSTSNRYITDNVYGQDLDFVTSRLLDLDFGDFETTTTSFEDYKRTIERTTSLKVSSVRYLFIDEVKEYIAKKYGAQGMEEMYREMIDHFIESGEDSEGYISPDGNDYDEHIDYLDNWGKAASYYGSEDRELHFYGVIDTIDGIEKPFHGASLCASSPHTCPCCGLESIGIYICTSRDESSKWIVNGYLIVEDVGEINPQCSSIRCYSAKRTHQTMLREGKNKNN